MADFGELCPLFNTGVFNEMIFPGIAMTHISLCGNALRGTTDQEASSLGNFTFSRTVVITAAWVRRKAVIVAAENLQLMHHDSAQAAGTEFGSLAMSTTVTGQCVGHGYLPMNVTETTFTSAAILGLCYGTVTEDDADLLDLIIRYKEK